MISELKFEVIFCLAALVETACWTDGQTEIEIQ